MTYQLRDCFKMFALNSNQKLAGEIAQHLGCELGKSSVTRFSDGEIQINIEESVRGCEVFLVQSTSYPGAEHVMELLIMIDALKRASAEKINVVIPYYGFARQDRKARSREPITAKLIANLLEKAGATRVISIDLHTPQIQGFFDIPVDQLMGVPILSEYYQNTALEDIVVVTPNHGGVARARKMASKLNAPIALIDIRRPQLGEDEVTNVIGSVEGRNAIIIDGVIDTATTMTLAANALVEAGAKSVRACCTHAILSGSAASRIESSPIKELVVTNTIELAEKKLVDNITSLSVAPLLANAIDRIHNEIAVSPLFD
ncbi:ribose-phosphate pyrophosphokinase [Domibacillus sp. PGB-M46]|uniref:ribose-phosphate pyrophosphokinase n=1 Tax=Domibacillus sp. PGB-M46 TaxID=2910255 RepID=UPI001F5721A3|nr:ribose-phosphate pyrophosphokinase [Domibacillus sp. PGB-M46]MCI2255736.1 ribose-phosphate pyrophosphokinase [Domibacillus sp. PGB-M46]